MKKKRRIIKPVKKIRKFKRKQKSFTLLEILVVLAIIVALAVGAFVIINPKKQIERSWDTKRKTELSSLAKSLEDFYNDKSCYPKPEEICYKDGDQLRCPVCGSETTSPPLDPYLSKLPCDPQHPNSDFLYEVDDSSCSTWFRIYTKLSDAGDPIIAESGCSSGCGPALAYSYGVSSPNTIIETADNTSADPTPTTSNSVSVITSTPVPTSVADDNALEPTASTQAESSWYLTTSDIQNCNEICEENNLVCDDTDGWGTDASVCNTMENLQGITDSSSERLCTELAKQSAPYYEGDNYYYRDPKITQSCADASSGDSTSRRLCKCIN